ncbi:MAG: hypothetical protein K6B46_05795 [Opitutales bacterium]|nr:hypothetical protein [Opitutales bacterium]
MFFRKIAIVFCAIFSTLWAGAAEDEKNADLVWYFPGWLRTKDSEGAIWKAFSETFPDAELVFKTWDGNGLWASSIKNADAAALLLAEEIVRMPGSERSRLILVGHSLGGRIVARAIANLGRQGIKVKSAILLAAAIPNDDPDLNDAGKGSLLPVISICNPDDVTLKYLYTLGGDEEASAAGAGGTIKKLDNFVEIAVPDDITAKTPIEATWGNFESLKRIANHYAPFYFQYLKQVLNGEQESDGRIMVPQDNLNLEFCVIDGEIWWRVLDRHEGWKLEQHKITGYCRILDPQKRRRAWGAKNKMTQAFEKLKAK